MYLLVKQYLMPKDFPFVDLVLRTEQFLFILLNLLFYCCPKLQTFGGDSSMLDPIRHLKSALKAPGEGGRRSWIFQLIKGFKKFAAEGEGFVPPPQYI